MILNSLLSASTRARRVSSCSTSALVFELWLARLRRLLPPVTAEFAGAGIGTGTAVMAPEVTIIFFCWVPPPACPLVDDIAFSPALLLLLKGFLTSVAAALLDTSLDTATDFILTLPVSSDFLLAAFVTEPASPRGATPSAGLIRYHPAVWLSYANFCKHAQQILHYFLNDCAGTTTSKQQYLKEPLISELVNKLVLFSGQKKRILDVAQKLVIVFGLVRVVDSLDTIDSGGCQAQGIACAVMDDRRGLLCGCVNTPSCNVCVQHLCQCRLPHDPPATASSPS